MLLKKGEAPRTAKSVVLQRRKIDIITYIIISIPQNTYYGKLERTKKCQFINKIKRRTVLHSTK